MAYSCHIIPSTLSGPPWHPQVPPRPPLVTSQPPQVPLDTLRFPLDPLRSPLDPFRVPLDPLRSPLNPPDTLSGPSRPPQVPLDAPLTRLSLRCPSTPLGPYWCHSSMFTILEQVCISPSNAMFTNCLQISVGLDQLQFWWWNTLCSQFQNIKYLLCSQLWQFSFHFISLHFNSSHIISYHLISSRFISIHLIMTLIWDSFYN